MPLGPTLPRRTLPAMPREIVRISDPADPRLDGFRDLRLGETAGERLKAESLIIAEGEIMARMLAASPHQAVSLLLSETKSHVMGELFPSAHLYIADRPVLDAVVGFAFHRGVLALAHRNPPPKPENLLANAPVAVVAERVSSYDNMGSLIRSMSALAPPGAALLLSPGCCDPLYRKTLRVSMGHALHVPFAELANYPSGLATLKAAGFATIALTPDPAASSIADFRLPVGLKPALLLGAEGPGLDESTMSAADIRLRIPMRPGVDSLNVAVAAAIAMHRLF